MREKRELHEGGRGTPCERGELHEGERGGLHEKERGTP